MTEKFKKSNMDELRRMLVRYVCSNAVSEEQFKSYKPRKNCNKEVHGPLMIAKNSEDYMWVHEWIGNKIKEYPVFLSGELDVRMARYKKLAEDRPELFAHIDSDHYPITTDVKRMLEYEEETGQKLGIVFDNYPFYYIIADLIEPKGKKAFRYVRVVYAEARSNGTVMIPCLEREGKEPLFGILDVFRHCIREYSGGEFPRGFMASGVSEEDNAARELKEEFGIERSQIKESVCIGRTRADTGLSSGSAGVYLIKLTGKPNEACIGHEGIKVSAWVSKSELLEMISDGRITDGFTQSALLLYELYMSKQ
ncbi:MAG: NUDIX domain-containing protein [Clostridia bacterium]|nr:NUDIX domain-containing protein [Clostridia bacterium]